MVTELGETEVNYGGGGKREDGGGRREKKASKNKSKEWVREKMDNPYSTE